MRCYFSRDWLRTKLGKEYLKRLHHLVPALVMMYV
jgi:hypothetical protein